ARLITPGVRLTTARCAAWSPTRRTPRRIPPAPARSRGGTRHHVVRTGCRGRRPRSPPTARPSDPVDPFGVSGEHRRDRLLAQLPDDVQVAAHELVECAEGAVDREVA